MQYESNGIVHIWQMAANLQCHRVNDAQERENETEKESETDKERKRREDK